MKLRTIIILLRIMVVGRSVCTFSGRVLFMDGYLFFSVKRKFMSVSYSCLLFGRTKNPWASGSSMFHIVHLYEFTTFHGFDSGKANV